MFPYRDENETQRSPYVTLALIALNVLAWEGVIALGMLIVFAPFALVAFAAWLGRRLYRRHEEERLLAT